MFLIGLLEKSLVSFQISRTVAEKCILLGYLGKLGYIQTSAFLSKGLRESLLLTLSARESEFAHLFYTILHLRVETGVIACLKSTDQITNPSVLRRTSSTL